MDAAGNGVEAADKILDSKEMGGKIAGKIPPPPLPETMAETGSEARG
jgi:hypothetical protein